MKKIIYAIIALISGFIAIKILFFLLAIVFKLVYILFGLIIAIPIYFYLSNKFSKKIEE